MLVGFIGTPREEMLANPQRMREMTLKSGEAIKQLPPQVTVKSRYVFGAGDNATVVLVFDVQSYEQLLPLAISLPEFYHIESFPVIDNTGEVVQKAVR